MYVPVADLDPDDVEEDAVRTMGDGVEAMEWEDVDFDDPKSHRELACVVSVSELAALGPAGALVLGFEGPRAGVKLLPEGALFVGVVWTSAEDEAAAAVEALDPTTLSFEDTGWTWPVDPGGVAMLSSCDINDDEWLEVIGSTVLDVELPAGDYNVATATWDPDDETSLQLVLVRPAT